MAIAPERLGIGIRRHFTAEGVHPYDEVAWERRDARITNWVDGSVAFEQLGVEVPAAWSVNATNILAQKYFRGAQGSPEREWSLKQVADRVADTICAWGVRGGYFADAAEANAFNAELKYLIVHQRAAFNSPVWFNIGVEGRVRQSSACFILSVEDSMADILNWYVEEGIIFKGGSGSGVNLSKIRSSRERLAGGGTASGPVSFMRGADASAGTIKSGGVTRRAAKMVILDADHPDIEDFVWCKAIEERKARALRAAGFDMDLDGRDSHSLQYQNANNSVRLTDEFMAAVEADGDWDLVARTTGEVVETVKARALFRQIAEAAWECADPGVQYDTTINRWHTLHASGRITASNPCSEYLSVDDSACNLASLNLLRYLRDDGTFDVEGFKASVAVVFTAQEILVGMSEYPTPKIDENTKRFRQLGLGYANLGALLMAKGLAYDSDEGRAWAASITALMTGHAYATSAATAARMGPFAGYHDNAEHMLGVLRMHRDAVAAIDEELAPTDVLSAAQEAWDEAVELGERHGVRNSQATVLAPTGTISFLLDCDTTGVEPDLGLVKTKKLVGGGTMSIVNQTVPRALRTLGYDDARTAAIVAHIDRHKTIVGAPGLRPDDLPVFACSMGDNVIHHYGHIRLMAAVQPFISGALSKCVAGDTLLSTADGLVRIGSLHEGEPADSFRGEIREVASLDGTQKTDAFYYGGLRPVRSVVLASGHRLVGTPNHRVLVAGDGELAWRRLDELEPADHVAVRLGAELWSPIPARFDDFRPSPAAGHEHGVAVPDEMTEDLARLLGMYAAEGHTTRRNGTVVITSSTESVLADAVRLWRAVFGLEARITRPPGGCPGVVVSAQTVVELLEHLGSGARASAKRIPDAVLCSPRPMVLAFLQGLALDASTSAGRTPRWAVGAESPGLLDDLQAVLTNLGIPSGRIGKPSAAAGGTCDEVVVSGAPAARLAGLVRSPYDTAADTTHDAADALDVVPGISPRALYELLPATAAGRRGSGVRTEFSYLRDGRTGFVTRRSLERVAAVPGVVLPAWLRTVLADDLHFSPVRSVGDAGLREVFDLSVPSTQAFVGNGIVNHNTVNLPESATVADVEALHLDAWKMGIKALAVYRDNCKVAQPLSTTKSDQPVSEAQAHDRELAAKVAELEQALNRQTVVVKQPIRERLPRRRTSTTFAFRVADCEGYVTVGEYDDGRPGEVFMKVSKQGSTLAGVMDAFSISVSLGLQHGVPLRTYVQKYTNMRFEPAGMTDDPELRIASSLVDYIFRRLAVDYLTAEERGDLGILTTEERSQPTLPGVEELATPSAGVVEARPVPPAPPAAVQRDAPFCFSCGNVMQRAGSCYACGSCGATSGCS